MKIAINALPYTSWQGIEIFLSGLLQNWPNNSEDEVIVFANEKSAEFLKSAPSHIKIIVISFSKLNKKNIFIHQQLSFHKILKRNKIDILFCPSLMTPWFFKKKIITIHDAAPFTVKDETSWLGKMFWKINLIPAKLWSKKIVTVSEFSRQELINKLGIRANKVDVIGVSALPPLEIDETTKEEVLKKLSLIDSPYFITVGNARTRKNLSQLISAFNTFHKKHPNTKLVVVGKLDHRMQELKKKANNKNIIFTGFISDLEKTILMSSAQALVFPSYYEGFGIPIIESQQLDTPVVCSDIPAFKEVAKESAIFFNPFDTSSINKSLEEIHHNKDLRHKLIEMGRDNYTRYSWDKIVDRLLNIIKDENTTS